MSNSYTGGCACGAIRYELAAADRMGVTAGSLNNLNRFRPTIVVWTSRAPSWDRIDPALQSAVENPARR